MKSLKIIKSKQETIAATEIPPEFLKELEVVYDQNYLQIYRFVYNRIERKEEASDVLSTTFYKAMRNADKFEMRNPGALKSWIFKIASNEVMLYYRKKKVERKYFVEKQYLQTITNDLEEEKPEMSLMLESLENLSSRDYELVQMKYFDEMSFREIAAIVGKSEDGLRVTLHRIRKKLATAVVELSKSKGIEILLALAVLLMVV